MSAYFCPTCGKVHEFGARRQAEPYHVTWQQMALDGLKDAGEVILGLIVFGSLFLGLPFLLWVIAS